MTTVHETKQTISDFRDPDSWPALFAQAASQKGDVHILFPSHVGELFEAATYAYGQFEAVASSIEDLLSKGCSVVLEHPITLATYRELPDLIRFVDDRFDSVAGISFWKAGGVPVPTDAELTPWLKAALHVCEQRGVGVEIRPDSGLVEEPRTALISPESDSSLRGMHPVDGIGKGRPAEVSLVSAGGGVEELRRALELVGDGLGSLSRFILDVPDFTPREVVWEITQGRDADGTARHPNELSTAQGYQLIQSLRDLRAPRLVLTGTDFGSRRDLPGLISFAKRVGLEVWLVGNDPPPDAEKLRLLVESGVSGIRLAPTGDSSWQAVAKTYDLGFEEKGPTCSRVDEMPDCSDLSFDPVEGPGGCPGGSGWMFISADGFLTPCSLRDEEPVQVCGEHASAVAPWRQACLQTMTRKSGASIDCSHRREVTLRTLLTLRLGPDEPRFEVVEALMGICSDLSHYVGLAVAYDPDKEEHREKLKELQACCERAGGTLHSISWNQESDPTLTPKDAGWFDAIFPLTRLMETGADACTAGYLNLMPEKQRQTLLGEFGSLWQPETRQQGITSDVVLNETGQERVRLGITLVPPDSPSVWLNGLLRTHEQSMGMEHWLVRSDDGSVFDLRSILDVRLSIVDGGQYDLLMASSFSVAIDRVGIEVTGASMETMPALQSAADNDVVGSEVESIRLLGLARAVHRRPTPVRASEPLPSSSKKIALEPDRCNGHASCMGVCPTHCITIEQRDEIADRPVPIIDDARCIRCYACVEHCPEMALSPAGFLDQAWEPEVIASKGLDWLAMLGREVKDVANETRPPAWQNPREANTKPIILGVAMTTQQHHGAVLLRDGELIAAVQEERFRRKKQYGWAPPGRRGETVVSDPTLPIELPFPWESIGYVLEEAGIKLEDVDHIAVNGVPGRFIETYSLNDPRKPPKTVQSGRFIYIPHHLAHAASAYHVSGLEDAYVFTVDGRGERETAAFFEPTEDGLVRTFDILAQRDTTIGGVYETVTLILGFGHYGQGSTMGLASLGDGSMDMKPYLSARDHEDYNIHWQGVDKAFGHLSRHRDGPLLDEHISLAASTQDALEETVISLIEGGLKGRKPRTMCLAGGVALNCSLNQRIRLHFGLDEIYVQPAAHDAGTALGAALEAHRVITGEMPRTHMNHAYWGPSYTNEQVSETLERFGLKARKSSDLESEVAELLANGKVVCWFQGRMEFGPRALGARSILADPRRRELKDRLNLIKRRQWWRPLGPSILSGREADYFETPFTTPFMLFTLPVRSDKQEEIPVVVHSDGTSRPQSVEKEVNPRYYRMIEHFEALTKVPMVVNTSFNTAFEPIVESPEDAISSFLQLGADYLAIEDYLVDRRELSAQIAAERRREEAGDGA